MRVIRGHRLSTAAASLWFCVVFLAIINESLGHTTFSRHRYILGDSAHGRKLLSSDDLSEQIQETLDDISVGASSGSSGESSSSSLANEINEGVQEIIDEALDDVTNESSASVSVSVGGSSDTSEDESSSSSSDLAAELNEEAQKTVDDILAEAIYWVSDSSGSADSEGGSSDSSSKTSSSGSSDSVNFDASELNEETKHYTDDVLEDLIPSSYDNLAADKNADAQARVEKTAILAAKNVPKASDLAATVTERLGLLADWSSDLKENLSYIQAKLSNLECAQHANKLRNALDAMIGLNHTNMVSFVMTFSGIDVIRDLDTSVPMQQFRALYTRAVQESAINLISKAEFSGCCPDPSVHVMDVSPRTYPLPPYLGSGSYGVAVNTRVLYGSSDADLHKKPLLLACARALKHVMEESAEPPAWEEWIQKGTISTVESLG